MFLYSMNSSGLQSTSVIVHVYGAIQGEQQSGGAVLPDIDIPR